VIDTFNYVKIDYERMRMSRYRGVKETVKYPSEEVYARYLGWATNPGRREDLWDLYCDVRDGVPLGTNKKIETSRRKFIPRVYLQA